MPKARFGFRDTQHVFFEENGAPNGTGTGAPYNTASGSGYKGPVVESSGLIKIVQNIQVPNAAIGAEVNWTSAGVYSGLDDNNYLPLFKYYSSIDPAREIGARSNFFLQDVQVFFGTNLTGAAAIGNTTVVLDMQIEAYPSNNVAWSASNVSPAVSNGRIQGSLSSSQTTRMVGGENWSDDYFYLWIQVDATSPVALSAGRIKVVMVGYEF